MEISEVLKGKRLEVLRLADRRGARNLRIFGSFARGEATKASDLDVIVDLDPDRSLFDLGGLLMDLQDLLGCKVDIVTENGLHWAIRDRILKEAVPL